MSRLRGGLQVKWGLELDLELELRDGMGWGEMACIASGRKQVSESFPIPRLINASIKREAIHL